ncbi:hypothetical protein [Pseudomonas sp. HLT2-19-2]
MFRTNESDMAGVPGMFGEGLSHWHMISRSIQTHWYHVTLKIRHEDRLVSLVVMPSDESKLHEILSSQSSDIVVTEVQAVTPPWMNRGGEWLMEKLSGVSIGFDGNDIQVCVLELESGSVYTDVHAPSFTVESLTKIRKIY